MNDRPIASSLPKSWRASASFTIATGCASATSDEDKVRPRRNGNAQCREEVVADREHVRFVRKEERARGRCPELECRRVGERGQPARAAGADERDIEQRCRSDARQRRELLERPGIERSRLHRRIPVAHRIEAKDQQVRWIEASLHLVKVPDRSHQQRRGAEEQHGQRHLNCDEPIRQHTAAPAGRHRPRLLL